MACSIMTFSPSNMITNEMISGFYRSLINADAPAVGRRSTRILLESCHGGSRNATNQPVQLMYGFVLELQCIRYAVFCRSIHSTPVSASLSARIRASSMVLNDSSIYTGFMGFIPATIVLRPTTWTRRTWYN